MKPSRWGVGTASVARSWGVIAASCLSCTMPQTPSSQIVTVPKPEADDDLDPDRERARLGLESLWPSADGESLVAWTNGWTDADPTKTFCAIGLASKRVRCWTESKDAVIAGFSRSGDRTLVRTPTHLRVVDSFTGAAVFFREAKRPLAAASMSPDGTWLAFVEEGGGGSIVELATQRVVPAAVDVSGGQGAAAQHTRLRWLDEGTVVFHARGSAPSIARPHVTARPVGLDIDAATMKPATPLAWTCADLASFHEGILVATCDGAVATFDRNGRETARVLDESKDRIGRDVTIDIAGRRVLVDFHDLQHSTLVVVEPGASAPLLFEHSGDLANADLSEDGRLGWLHISYGADGMDLQSFTKDVTTTTSVATNFPEFMIFHAWSGTRALTTQGSTMLYPPPAPAAEHYLAWAPWPDVMRRGSFLWAGAGNGFLRVADGDEEFTLFDVFGARTDARVVTVRPEAAPPPPTPTSEPPVEDSVGGWVRGD